jgi:hypothetical protein
LHKYDRIRLLRHLGLNTEVSVLIESESDLRRHEAFLAPLERMSVRTFSRTGATDEPHFPIIGRATFETDCLPLLDQGYSLIVAEPIDPAGAQLAGCILRRPEDFLVELAEGPGTVRRVTHEGKIDLQLAVSGPDDPRCRADIRPAVTELAEAERQWRADVTLMDVLYEFSVYAYPVGWKNEPVIFWEITGLGDQNGRLDKFYREAVPP